MNFNLTVLGTASAMPLADKNASAHVLDVQGRLFLIDCGEGTQKQLIRYKKSIQRIEAIYISHIHGDHIFGLFPLFSTMALQGRLKPLHVYAPNSLSPILKFFMSYFGEGLRYEIEFHPLKMKTKELIFETKSLEIYAFPLNHKIETFGFLIKEKEKLLNVRKEKIYQYDLTLQEIAAIKRGEDIVRDDEIISNAELSYKPTKARSYAYCSDTAPFAELADWVRDVDVLYHECTFLAKEKDLAKSRFHSTSHDAAQCALDAGAAKLLIAHYSSRHSDIKQYEKECREIFPESYALKDGDSFDL